MIERIRQLIGENSMCVLATCHNNVPHCSFMTYVANPEAGIIYMVTRKETRKYTNLLNNPQVSLLIDTRSKQGLEQRTSIQALTISGVCTTIEEPAEVESFRRQILDEHPHLKELVEHPDAAVISVRANSFLLLDGALHAHYVSAAAVDSAFNSV
ncbi:MAG: pyridoxamine 5'-phosphate oxidase family protein [Desulforhabdus sp.]|nr:pyridoxamine 5'-phosphate oxidase family protein [Desulforhabdus sp.]